MTEQPDTLALVYVSVGSNIEPERHVEAALGLLLRQVCVTAVSTFYCTEPIGRPEQSPYLNGVFELRTDLPASDITPQIQFTVETQLGRVRTEDKYASRTLDLDLILYNDLETGQHRLRLPHPDLERAFVAGPIHELLSRPDLHHACQSAMLGMLPRSVLGGVMGQPKVAFSKHLNDMLLQN